MGIIQAVVLGIIQGATEFIPVSSSAHLVIIRWVLGWNTENPGIGIALDVALHLGTLFALLTYFWKDWSNIIKSHLSTTRLTTSHKPSTTPSDDPVVSLWPIILASIPAGIAGIALEDTAANVFRAKPILLATALIGLGLLMLIADKKGKKTRSLSSVVLADWMIVGFAQALAIIPGVSRSGITITAGLLTGLKREVAAKISFLLGTPIILGAALYEVPKLFTQQLTPTAIGSVIIGVITSTVVGYLCIGFLLKYLQRQSVAIFVAYRIIIGIALIVANFVGVLRV
jgi:undecaprenyl-diphosphatase